MLGQMVGCVCVRERGCECAEEGGTVGCDGEGRGTGRGRARAAADSISSERCAGEEEESECMEGRVRDMCSATLASKACLAVCAACA